MARLRVIGFILSGLIMSGCTRAGQSGSSHITIQAPNSLFNKALHSQFTLPAGRLACYGINIKGLGLAADTGGCRLPAEMLAGFVRSGQVLEASVNKGKTIEIELYLYLQPTGATGACPEFSGALNVDQLTNVYLVGTATGIAITNDQTDVTINADFPGLAQNISQQLTLPSACHSLLTDAGDRNPGHWQISVSDQMAIEQGKTARTGVKLIGRVGGGVPKGYMSAVDGSKLIIK